MSKAELPRRTVDAPSCAHERERRRLRRWVAQSRGGAAVIYGTDVFGAIVLRPAIAAVGDRTFTQLLVHIHRIADRRFPAMGAGGLIAAMAVTAVAAASGHWVSAAAGALATLTLIIFLAIYSLVSKPVTTALTAAALADRVPGDARQLQARWDSVINARVTLQTIALAAFASRSPRPDHLDLLLVQTLVSATPRRSRDRRSVTWLLSSCWLLLG